jgi:hypothetical protein
MSRPERTRVSRWIRLRSFAVGKYKRVQLSIERRSFEGKLERIVRNALAHQSLGLPVGHQPVAIFGGTFGQIVYEIFDQIPAGIPECDGAAVVGGIGLGVSQGHFSYIERGEKEIGAEILLRISREFGKSIEWLLTGEG